MISLGDSRFKGLTTYNYKGVIEIAKKTNMVGCKLSDDELNLLSTLVMQSGLSNQSEYFRQRILESDKTNIPGQVLLDKIIEMNNKLDTVCRKMLKQEYVIKKLAAAILVERTSNELVTEFVSKMEEEAEELYGKS